MKHQALRLTLAALVGLGLSTGAATAETITFEGSVERIIDSDTFTVATDAGSERVYLSRTEGVPFATGETLTVTGIVDSFPRREIYATRIVRADGSEMTFVIE